LNLASNRAVAKSAPPDNPAALKSAILKIQKQANRSKGLYSGWGNTTAAQRVSSGVLGANLINARAHQLADDLLSGPLPDVVEAAEVNRNAAVCAYYAQTNGQAQAARAQEWAAKAQTDLQITANNLASQLDQRGPFQDDAVLRSVGTNLNVRYYGT